MRVTRALVCAVGVVLTIVSFAKELRYTKDKDGNPVIWQEIEAPLPPFPEEANLVRFPAPVSSGRNTFYIDRASIALGSDLVLRYTVVVRSPTGVQNTIHEGIACDVREVKTYAYGNSKRQFSELSKTSWSGIAYRGVKGYQSVLADRFLCDESHGYIDRDQVLERLDAAASGLSDDLGEGSDDND